MSQVLISVSEEGRIHELGAKLQRRINEAYQARQDAQRPLAEAKAHVERMTETFEVYYGESFVQKTIPLKPGVYYHIYNRGINGENIFRQERNYAYFLQLYALHIELVADTFAYCLLRNHFHLLARIKETFEVSETSKVLEPTQQFSNLFNAYAKAINKAYQRTGSLCEHRFGRIPITSDHYFMQLTQYIHFNPQKHGFVTDFREWLYSSYHTLLSDKPTRLKRDDVLGWFDGRVKFADMHQALADERAIKDLISDDDD